MSMLNHKIFFDNVKPLFGKRYTKSQVEGIDLILDTWEARYIQRTPPTQFADVFATAWLETGATMQPVHEIGNLAYFTRLYDIRGSNPSRARKMGNVRPGDGARYCGRGYIQLTWYLNYLRADKRLHELGVLKPNESLIDFPDLAMRPDVALVVMFEGMEGGWFTGKSLDDIIDINVDGDEHADFLKARRIINGTDRDEKIATAADKILKALTAALA